MITPQRMLIIEDECVVMEFITKVAVLLWPHLLVQAVASLEAALAVMAARCPDMVLADLKLPDSPAPMTTLAAVMRALPPITPVIVFSGAIGEVEKQQVLRLGADACLLKMQGDPRVELTRALAESWARACGRQLRQGAFDGLVR